MTQYRVRTTVEAWQYTGDNADALHKILGRMKRDLPHQQIGVYDAGSSVYRVVQPSDWIIRDNGKLEVCTAEFFAERYEVAAVDYKVLLAKYMAHVGAEEGTTFLVSAGRAGTFTEEEFRALVHVAHPIDIPPA